MTFYTVHIHCVRPGNTHFKIQNTFNSPEGSFIPPSPYFNHYSDTTDEFCLLFNNQLWGIIFIQLNPLILSVQVDEFWKLYKLHNHHDKGKERFYTPRKLPFATLHSTSDSHHVLSCFLLPTQAHLTLPRLILLHFRHYFTIWRFVATVHPASLPVPFF